MHSPSVKLETTTSKVSLYPNPTSREVYIDTDEAVLVEVFDMMGKKILTTNAKKIDISTNSSGVYFVKVSIPTTEAHKVFKLLKK